VTNPTPVTEHVTKCVKLLNKHLQNRSRHMSMEEVPEDVSAFESVFELISVPWDAIHEDDQEWREGYETCLLDVVDHIAQAWGITLPPFRVAAKGE